MAKNGLDMDSVKKEVLRAVQSSSWRDVPQTRKAIEAIDRLFFHCRDQLLAQVLLLRGGVWDARHGKDSGRLLARLLGDIQITFGRFEHVSAEFLEIKTALEEVTPNDRDVVGIDRDVRVALDVYRRYLPFCETLTTTPSGDLTPAVISHCWDELGLDEVGLPHISPLPLGQLTPIQYKVVMIGAFDVARRARQAFKKCYDRHARSSRRIYPKTSSHRVARTIILKALEDVNAADKAWFEFDEAWALLKAARGEIENIHAPATLQDYERIKTGVQQVRILRLFLENILHLPGESFSSEDISSQLTNDIQVKMHRLLASVAR